MKHKMTLDEMSCPTNEFSQKATVKYCGRVIIENKQFYRYLVNSKPFIHAGLFSTVSCNSDRVIEILLPPDQDSGSKAFFREANLNSSVCIDQPAKIQYGEIDKLSDPKSTLLNYPNNIFYYYSKPFQSNELKINYHFISEDQQVRLIDVIIDSSDLKFICRNRGEYIASYLLYPFILGFDILILPISLPFFLMWASGSGV